MEFFTTALKMVAEGVRSSHLLHEGARLFGGPRPFGYLLVLSVSINSGLNLVFHMSLTFGDWLLRIYFVILGVAFIRLNKRPADVAKESFIYRKGISTVRKILT